MSSEANAQHMKLINKLKMVEKYKNTSIALTIKTWSFSSGVAETDITLWWSEQPSSLFRGNKMVDLERFINKERKEAGIFQERK